MSNHSKEECLLLTTKDQSYVESIGNLVKQKEFLDWTDLLKNNNSKMILMESLNKTEFIDKKCYWVIPVYESKSSHINLWKEFLVQVNEKEVYERIKSNRSIRLIR